MGEKLLKEISDSTGLPKDLVDAELVRLLIAAGLDPRQTTLEDLRSILCDYAQDILVEAKTSLEPKP